MLGLIHIRPAAGSPRPPPHPVPRARARPPAGRTDAVGSRSRRPAYDDDTSGRSGRRVAPAIAQAQGDRRTGTEMEGAAATAASATNQSCCCGGGGCGKREREGERTLPGQKAFLSFSCEHHVGNDIVISVCVFFLALLHGFGFGHVTISTTFFLFLFAFVFFAFGFFGVLVSNAVCSSFFFLLLSCRLLFLLRKVFFF